MPGPYQSLDVPVAEFHGVNLSAAPDALRPGEYTILQNVSDSQVGELPTRAGTVQVGPSLGQGPIHSVTTLFDPVSAYPAITLLYVLGAGTSLYGWSPGDPAWTTLATGFSGNPLTFVVYRLSGTGEPWLIVGDSAKMVKVNSAKTVWQLGITPDPDQATVQVIGALTKPIASLNSLAGIVAGTATTAALNVVSATSMVRASGIVTAMASTSPGFFGGLPFEMTGPAGDESWNGTFVVASTVGVNAWTYSQPAANDTATSGTATVGIMLTGATAATLSIASVDSEDLTTIDDNASLAVDTVQLWFYVDDVTQVEDAQVLFDVDPASVSGGTLTSSAFTTNYYYASFFSQLSSGWNLISVPKSSFTRAGQGDYDWSGIQAWEIVVYPTASGDPTIIVEDMYLQGQSYPDASVGVGYDWRETRYNSLTKSESNPSPIMAVPLYPVNQAVALLPGSISADPQVNTIRWWRRGGSLASNWYLVGTQPNAPLSTIAPAPLGVVMDAAGTQATYTTEGPHGLSAGDTAFVSGVPSGFPLNRAPGQRISKPTVGSQVIRENVWVNPQNAVSPTLYATCTLYASNYTVNSSSFLQVTGFTSLQALPSDATITGLKVTYTRAQTAGTSEAFTDTVSLLGVSGVPQNVADGGTPWTGTPTAVSASGPWRVLPTLQELQSPNFGFQIGCYCIPGTGTGADIEINGCSVTVSYTSALETQFDGFFPILTVPTPTSFVVANTIAGGGVTSGGGTVQAAFIDAQSDAEIAAAPILSLTNDTPVTVVNESGDIVYGSPLPRIWGPYAGTTLFGCGNIYEPGYLFWCNPSAPDMWSSLNNLEVTQPSDPLTNGTYWSGTPWARSTESLFQIFPASIAGFYSAQDVGSGESLGSPWALVGGSFIPFMGWLGKSGIFISSGGTGQSITDDKLWPLFDPQSTRADAVDWTHPELLRMAWYDHHLRFVYQGKDGIKRFYIWDADRSNWTGPHAYGFAGCVEYNEPETTEALLIGGADGNLYQWDTAATSDNGVAIPCLIQSRVFKPSGFESDCEWGHLNFDSTAPVGGIKVLASFNDTLTNYVALGSAVSTSRYTTPLSMQDQYSTGASIQASWSGQGSVFGFSILYRNDGQKITHCETPATSFGAPGYGHAYRALVCLRSTGVVNLTATVDNVVLPAQAIPSTGNTRLRYEVFLPLNKGYLCQVALDAVGGQGFKPYAADSSLEWMPWSGINPIETPLPFFAGNAEGG